MRTPQAVRTSAFIAYALSLLAAVIVAYLLTIVTLFIVINFIVDVIYSVLDPRVSLGGQSAGGH